MSSQLHEAVRLAQAGNKDDARQMLRQIVQTDPNNEMAWLWLASVAADREEYQRALQEVLRINPANAQARNLMAQFQQQQQQPPIPQPTPYAPPAAYYPQQPAPMMAPVVVQPAKRRGCCSCTSCLILLAVLVIVPALVCGALSYTARSLGPLDLIAGYLPGDFGRKNVEFLTGEHTVSISVPRSWYPAIEGDTWWDAWQQALDERLPLVAEAEGWATYEITREALTSGREGLTILEMNPATLASSGGVSGVNFVRIVEPDADDLGFDSFRCDDVRPAVEAGSELLEFDSGRCGIRTDSTMDVGSDRFFESYDPPAEMRVIRLMIPAEANLGSEWVIIVPEEQYNMFEGDIEHMIDTITVE